MPKPFGKIKHIHFIGIGGIGMSGIAKVVRSMGYLVTGSDQKESDILNELRSLGITVSAGHDARHVSGAEVVVTSSAITAGNPELILAREKNIPVIQRGEMLAELMRLKTGIAVAGTHGKTTTTSLVSSILKEGGLSPTAVIGGKWMNIGDNVDLGKSKYLVCEADESDGSFLKLSPTFSVVTNIDQDHMDYFKTPENLETHFIEFMNKTPFYGKNVLCADDPGIQALLARVKKPYITYAIDSEAEVKASDIQFVNQHMEFRTRVNGEDLGVFKIKILGKHNVLNSLAAISIGLEMEIPPDTIRKALENFSGVRRRMESHGKWGGYEVIDDYGHHPTEIKATLDALRYKTDHLIVIFQPHRYSRTLEHYADFASSFGSASEVYLTEIYPAGEAAIPGVSTALIYDKMDKQKTQYFKDTQELVTVLKKKSHGGKGIILTIGAGDVHHLGKGILKDGH
jgi:UDP-N-acetylmuramate--alanine ligase